MDEPTASGDPADVARSLINQGVGTALVTLGADGCVVAQGQQAFCIRPPKVRVIDGYGAGAAFSAGIIFGLRAGWSLDSSARFASAYAGLKCEAAGIAELPISEVQKAAATLDVRPLFL
jgi:fructose-1-phosphate kinase PfkB-like protein